jgi:hypothetical protein
MTLKEYREIAVMLFPKAVPMLDEKIAESGEDSEVLAAESQMLYVLNSIQQGE